MSRAKKPPQRRSKGTVTELVANALAANPEPLSGADLITALPQIGRSQIFQATKRLIEAKRVKAHGQKGRRKYQLLPPKTGKTVKGEDRIQAAVEELEAVKRPHLRRHTNGHVNGSAVPVLTSTAAKARLLGPASELVAITKELAELDLRTQALRERQVELIQILDNLPV